MADNARRQKFAAIKDVAEFVGSPLLDWDLCCIATEGSKDMGSHTALRKDRGKVTSRFGKWKVRRGALRCEQTATYCLRRLPAGRACGGWRAVVFRATA